MEPLIKYRRLCAKLLAGALALAAFGGCASVERGEDGLPVLMDGAESREMDNDLMQPIALDWYIHFSWFTTSWGENLVSRAITQDTGIKINFITPPGNEWEKLNAMMAAGSLPDLVTLGHWETQINQMIEEDLVYPLNQLADRHNPGFWEVAHPQRVDWYRQPDGNLYAYPNSSYAPWDYERHQNIGSNQSFLVRKDLYEALGCPDMTTPEGFAQAVRDAAELCPVVDGKALIPIGLYDFDKVGCYSLEGILMNLLAVPWEEDGGAYDRYTHPDYIAWLKVFRGLCQEGYITDEVFVLRRTQMAEKVAQGQYFCMLYQHTDIADQQKYLYNNTPERVYIAVDGPKNAAGDDHTLPGVGINGWTVTLISRSCAYPDRAIQLLSYLISEPGQRLTYLGVEGETYDMVDGAPVLREEVLEILNTDREQYNRLYGADNTYWMMQDLAMQLDWKPPAFAPVEQPEIWSYPYTGYYAQYETNFGADSHVAAVNQQIREEWGNALPQLLLAKDDEEFDAIYAQFLERREKLGHNQVLREASRQMAQAKERLGLA